MEDAVDVGETDELPRSGIDADSGLDRSPPHRRRPWRLYHWQHISTPLRRVVRRAHRAARL